MPLALKPKKISSADIHGTHSSPPPQLYTGRHHGPTNYPSSCGDSTGYHSAMSSCLSIPGQHSCCNLYPPSSSPNRSGVRLSRCYSDWTISSTLKAPYDSFHGNHFSSTAHLFDDEEKQDSKLLPSVQISPHHDSTSPGGQLCKCTNGNREMAAHCKASRPWLLHGEATEKDSPRQTKFDSSQKSIDELYHLVEATQQITSAYSTFTVKVANLLSQCSVSSILLWLSCKLSMNAPGCLSIPQTAPVFQAKSVHEVFKEIQSYTSWLDYTLTAALAEELGGEEGKKLVSEYEAKLKPHLEKRVAVFQPDYLTTPYGFKELQVKLDWELAKTDYERVIRFRITLSRLLCTQPSCFILKGLREGCVLLTWLVPEHLCPAMVDSAKANFDLLASQAILAITVMGYTVTVQVGKFW